MLIRVGKTGIRGTDYALFSRELGAPLPIIVGHEGVGEIAMLGSDIEGFTIGEGVTSQPNFSCGQSIDSNSLQAGSIIRERLEKKQPVTTTS
ncbi:MAG: alcohol dehydrogenase catalytic domain-containing protein [Planctomycetota bacterium]|jgi:threonine dehydrogenase-like Zn-dependent dehydrogenase